MLKIGCHLSSSKGFKHMGEEAISIAANVFQFFTRNPRGGKAKVMNPDDAEALNNLLQENSFGQILAHAPYTLNPCSKDPGLRGFATEMFSDDLSRLEYLPGNLYNFHPGSHGGQGIETGISQIALLLNKCLWAEQKTVVLLETMAGVGTEVGSRFEELAAIIAQVELADKLGVCLDTCHVFDAGYDIVNRLDEVLEEFDRLIGLQRLRAIHLNDSLHGLSSHKDRHAVIGGGKIGLEAITAIINHPALRELPFFLETPNELPGYAAEIKLLRGLYK